MILGQSQPLRVPQAKADWGPRVGSFSQCCQRERQDWVGWGGAGQREKLDIKSPMGKESSGGLPWRKHKPYGLLSVLGFVEWGAG